MIRPVILAGWALVALLVVACELVSLLTHRRYAGFSSLLERASSGRIGLVLCFVGWMWVGWHFFAR